jgi:KUP system potassium uptake protein
VNATPAGPVETVDDQDVDTDVRRSQPPPPAISTALGALGIVFGDIGTSPLYTMKTVIGATGSAEPATALGALSLLVWTLVIVATLKYVVVAMRLDNDGEGGILALLSLIRGKSGHRPAIVVAALFGAALIYGDGTITPAISVLSALEGLHIAIPKIDPFVLPLAVAVLLALFAFQPRGTQSIGRVFGPIMLTWFVVIALLGISGIVQHPSVLAGLSPVYAVAYLVHGGFKGFALLGSVFLCVTGAEALYADMGHFGRRPIRLSWFAIVFPALVLNYAGQAALILEGQPTADNIFFRLCPSGLVIPLVLLATAATIVASQAVVTGAFSMTRQAIQLGWLPRLLVKQTSDEGYGQIYVGTVNWMLMIVTVGLTLGFRHSDNLASAYGIAVSATMLVTSALLYLGLHEVKGWPKIAAGAVAGIFLLVDGTFFASNSLKLLEGGWVPLVIAGLIFGLMHVWHTGVAAVAARLRGSTEPLPAFFDRLERDGVCRPSGTAVFLSRLRHGTPPLLAWHVRQNRTLYDHVVILTRISVLSPRVSDDRRFDVAEEAPNAWRVTVRMGFMERLDLEALLPALRTAGCGATDQAIFYVGNDTIVRPTNGWRSLSTRVFAFLEHNQAHLTDVLGLPGDRVVELGRYIEL